MDSQLEQVQVLVLVPSRELAIQIENVFKSLGSGFKVNSCYGGHPIQVEKNNLKHPPAILIGTPGRIVDHLQVTLPRPRTYEMLSGDAFGVLRDRIWRHIRKSA
jgi:ATP-independent RNA helicase DbpA